MRPARASLAPAETATPVQVVYKSESKRHPGVRRWVYFAQGGVMVRGRRLPAVLALLALVATGCGRLTQAAGLSTPGGPPDPAHAIALSILDQSIYLVDPNSGRSEAIVPNLTSFQSGYASWAPNHRALAYGNGGVHIFNPATAKSVQLVPGQTVSMPAWSPKGKAIVYGSGVSSWVTPVANPTPLQI